MSNRITTILSTLLTAKEKKKVFVSLVLMSFFTLVEVTGVSLIPLYINWVVVGREGSIFEQLGFYVQDQLTIGILLAGFVAFGTYFSYLVIKLSLNLSHRIGARISSDIMALFLTSRSNMDQSKLINQVTLECDRVSSFVITPLFFLFSRLVLAVLMIAVLFVYNFSFAFPSVLLIGVIFFVLFMGTRGRLAQQGTAISRSNSERIHEIKTVFGLKQEISLYRKEKPIVDRFADISFQYGASKASVELISKQPRYVFETVVLAGGIVLALLLSNNNQIDSLEFMLVFGVVGYKLMPAIHQLQSFYSILKGNKNAVKTVSESLAKLKSNQAFEDPSLQKKHSSFNSLKIRSLKIKSENGPLTYENIEIESGKTYGIMGPSGSGKSSLMEAIAGLSNRVLDSDLYLNGKKINYDQYSYIAKSLIGYVPQSSVTYGTTVSESISLEKGMIGLEDEFYKYKWAFKSRDFSGDYLDECLSGGEGQRLNLARAFYYNRGLTLLDESMSGLDEVNKGLVWQDVTNFVKRNNKTIIAITHDKSDAEFIDEMIDLTE